MIKSFRHKGLERFFLTGSLKGIQAIHAKKLQVVLTVLNKARFLKDLDFPTFRLHKLKGEMEHLFSITVQANWRITFEFKDENVYIVDYTDYH